MRKRSWGFFWSRMDLCASVAVMVATLSGCGPRMVTVTFPERDGNSEYWVCNRQGKECHGKQAGDVDPTLYEPGLSATLPHQDCSNGVARIEIVVKGSDILQLGYECAQPSASDKGPTGLPAAPPSTGGSLPSDASGAGATAAPTGLPPDAPEAAGPAETTGAGATP